MVVRIPYYTINWQPKSTPLSNKAFKILNLFKKAGEKSLFSSFLNEYCETNSPTIPGKKNNEWSDGLNVSLIYIIYVSYIGLHNNYRNKKSQSMLRLHYWEPSYVLILIIIWKLFLVVITYGLLHIQIKSKKGNLKNAIYIDRSISRFVLTNVYCVAMSIKVYIDWCLPKFPLVEVYQSLYWLVST